MKCHVGADAFSGLVHTITVTTANGDNPYPFLPRDDLFHDLQEFFPLRFLLPAAVFYIRKVIFQADDITYDLKAQNTITYDDLSADTFTALFKEIAEQRVFEV